MKSSWMRWLLALVCVLSVGPVLAQTSNSQANSALAWMRTQQQADGSFNGFGIGTTADALYALSAAGINADTVAVNGVTAHQFVEKNIAKIAETPGVAAKYVIAELLIGRNPRNVAGTNLVAVVQASYNPSTGVYGADVTTHALAMLALVAAGEPVPAEAVTALQGYQLEDGSWSFTGDRTPNSGDTNTTAMAVQALVAVGQGTSASVSRAVQYLDSQQNADGGFPYSQASQFGTDSDANSTALTIQAIVAVGQNPTSGVWADANGNPLQALLAMQNASGAFKYSAALPDDNTLATYQAIPAILLKPFPLQPVVITQPMPVPTATPVPGAPIALPDTSGTGSPWLPLVAVGVAAIALGARTRRKALR